MTPIEILSALGGTGVIATLITNWANKRKSNADIAKTNAETLSTETKTSLDAAKIYSDLLEEYKKREINTQESVKRMQEDIRDMRNQINQHMQNAMSMLIENNKLREKIDGLMTSNTELLKKVEVLERDKTHN